MHVGLAGAGRIGSLHARVLVNNPRVTTLTIADTDAARAAQVAQQVGARIVDSPDQLFRDGLDAVVIATATPSHAALLHQAADTRLPAFCEKPIALDLKTTDEVLGHIKQAGILVQIGFQRRFDAGYAAARAAVQSGTVGDLYVVRVAGHDPAPPPEAYVAASGGIWRDLAIHDFDVIPWVTGQQIVEVYADGAVHQPLFARHDDVDVAAAVFRLSGGALGIMSAGRHDPLGYDIRMEIFGSKDSLVVGLDGRTPLRSLPAGASASPPAGWRDFMERFDAAYRAELAAFLQTVVAGGPSPCSGDDARRALLVAMAAERSRAQRRPVSIAEVENRRPDPPVNAEGD
jgi:myo-inositol 2-dehydrogenase/D-chiro-inositol 1-dehydrogenase